MNKIPCKLRQFVRDASDEGAGITGIFVLTCMYVYSGLDMDKIRCTLRQFVRDWSDEGAGERKQSYKPITEALERYTCSVLCLD